MKSIESSAMKIAEAAKFLSISVSYLQDLADTGKIPCKKLGRSRYFIKSDLQKWQSDLPDWAGVPNGKTA